MTNKFILAEDGKTPIPEPDLLKWAQWFESAKRHVADDEIGAIRVSTVFLGLDRDFRHAALAGKDHIPILWVTTIFGAPGELDGYQQLYATYEGALRGHRKAVELARKALAEWQMTMNFDIHTFDVQKFDSILARGLSKGMGERGKQVCITAAICETLGLPHSDDSQCVLDAGRAFTLTLNDAPWSSPEARARGLRDLGLAQLGSLGVIRDQDFAERLAKKVIQVLVPKLLREVFPDNKKLQAAADRCEKEGTYAAASYATERCEKEGTCAAAPAYAACYAAYFASRYAARYGAVAYAAEAAAAACKANGRADRYLILAANLALDVLRELKSPGVELLSR